MPIAIGKCAYCGKSSKHPLLSVQMLIEYAKKDGIKLKQPESPFMHPKCMVQLEPKVSISVTGIQG